MKSLGAGFRALGHGKLILLLAVTTVVLGVGAAIPFGSVFEQDFGGTLAGDHLLRNHPTFAPSDVLDFGRERASLLSGVAGGSRYFLLLTILLQAFFAGGIVAVLGRGRFTFGQFFEPARRNFWHNLKCLFLFAILLAVVLGAVLGGAFAADEKLFESTPPGAASAQLFGWTVKIVGVLLWLGISYGFGVYLGYVNSYTTTYGALGGGIIFLTWLWLSSIALLFGAEINDVLADLRKDRSPAAAALAHDNHDGREDSGLHEA